jgi:hypothetical protein
MAGLTNTQADGGVAGVGFNGRKKLAQAFKGISLQKR